MIMSTGRETDRTILQGAEAMAALDAHRQQEIVTAALLLKP
jgi:hypothetical protein